MALKASIFKLSLNVSDINRHVYQSHTLTLARHPSETDERMMMRVLAFALNSDDLLCFGKGLSNDDEPDVWRKSLSGEIEQWLDVGLPSADRCRKACQRSLGVKLYVYGHEKNIAPWWKKIESQLQRFDRLQVLRIKSEDSLALAAMVQASMDVQVMIEGEDIYVTGDNDNVHIVLNTLKPARE